MSACAARAVPTARPTRGRTHPRVVAYDAGNVTRLLCAPGRSTSIELGADEVVDTIAVGDDKAWVVVAGGQPRLRDAERFGGAAESLEHAGGRPQGGRRDPALSVRLAPVDPGAAMAGLRVVYPDDIRAERAAAAAKAREAAAARKARDRLAIDYAYGPRNWRFVACGGATLEPTGISGDGQSTAREMAAPIRSGEHDLGVAGLYGATSPDHPSRTPPRRR